MRFRSLVLLAALGGAAAAGDHPGKVIRIERPATREVFVPAGTFWMGVTEQQAEDAAGKCHDDYEPTHGEPPRFIQTPSGVTRGFCERYAEELDKMKPRQVTLSAFAIDRDEVTVRDYRACVVAGGCAIDALVDGDERYMRDDWPMVNVTWGEARELCRWRGGRLPTEAEWERAARGDSTEGGSPAWPWGDVDRPHDFNHGQARGEAMRDIDRFQNLALGDPDASDGTQILAKPGSYPWSDGPYGTHDQAGNVAEWTADARGATDATLGYAGLPSVNPRRDWDPKDPQGYVVRGGSWRQPEFLARANLRDPFSLQPSDMMYKSDRRFSHVGFRCARSL